MSGSVVGRFGAPPGGLPPFGLRPVLAPAVDLPPLLVPAVDEEPPPLGDPPLGDPPVPAALLALPPASSGELLLSPQPVIITMTTMQTPTWRAHMIGPPITHVQRVNTLYMRQFCTARRKPPSSTSVAFNRRATSGERSARRSPANVDHVSSILSIPILPSPARKSIDSFIRAP